MDLNDLFGGALKLHSIRRISPEESTAERIKVGAQMVEAASRGLEWYLPVMGEVPLQEEGGISETSYKNLCLLMEKLGKPIKVERQANGNVLVHWPKDKCYLATGFDAGYFGTGPFYFARFGEKAGFGECDELYMKITDMDRNFAGVVWER